jgi:hypothetical protein
MEAVIPDEIDEQLARDRRMYGESFEHVDVSGKRTRIDPARITIRNRALTPASPYKPRKLRCSHGVNPLNHCNICD